MSRRRGPPAHEAETAMPAYIVARVDIQDDATFDAYQDAVVGSVKRGGRTGRSL